MVPMNPLPLGVVGREISGDGQGLSMSGEVFLFS